MNQLEGLLILTALPLGILLAGYWMASLLVDHDASERIAYALVAGLALMLAAVAAVNYFQPLRGVAAYACLAPVLLTVLVPASRASLVRDMTDLLRHGPRAVLAGGALFFALLLWPVLLNPAELFYDATTNHDSFFWVAGAEHLKRNTYMDLPVISDTQPLTNATSAIIGWQPPWGRVGSEALLALTSSVINVSPLKLYLYATASLAVVWFALVWLALRTFVSDAPARLTAAAAACFQPILGFFHGNANLPNLLGTLTGTALIIAVERTVRAAPGPRGAFLAWAALATFSLHGLLCSYPEMLPFALLPCGLLWLRPWFTAARGTWWRAGLFLTAALGVGFALNAVTTVRAIHGFLASFSLARADATWANLFQPLESAEYVPAFFTLSISACKRLGGLAGWPLTLLILGLIGLVVWRSRDRYGLLAGLAGGMVLLAYTLATGFAYGLQKTVQFSGVFVTLLFPVAAVDLLLRSRAGARGIPRHAATAALGAIAAFMIYTSVMNCLETGKWSDRKVLSEDWFALRDQSRTALKDAPVLVEAASFRMAFFHSMWSTYFLHDSRLYFGARGEESAGYLRSWVVNEQRSPIPDPAAILVGRPWADSFDANSPRLLTGREFALLQNSNRVLHISGWFPLNGLPIYATREVVIDLLPHRDSALVLEFAPRRPAGWPAGEWEVLRTATGAEAFAAQLDGVAPWNFRIPLVAGQPNRVVVRLRGESVDRAREESRAAAAAGETDTDWLFVVRTVRIEDAP
jgi:hypothetical protein